MRSDSYVEGPHISHSRIGTHRIPRTNLTSSSKKSHSQSIHTCLLNPKAKIGYDIWLPLIMGRQIQSF